MTALHRDATQMAADIAAAAAMARAKFSAEAASSAAASAVIDRRWGASSGAGVRLPEQPAPASGPLTRRLASP